jgi:hypothetical protein
MAVDVIIDPSSGQIYWNDQAGSGTQTIAISGNATNAINVVGYSNFFSPGGGGLGTQILATFTDSATSTFTPGTNAYDLGSTSLRWNFYGTGGNFTGAISTSSTTASTSSTTGALVVTGGAGIAKTSYFGESVVVQGSTASTNPTTGALVVTGGVGISGRLNVGSSSAANVYIQNTGLGSAYLYLSTGTGASLKSASIERDSDRFGIYNVFGTITNYANVFQFYHTYNDEYLLEISSAGATFYTTTASTSSTTGALTLLGGAGIAKTSYFGQDVKIQGSTASGSTTTGALVVTGGVGIGGSLNVFGTIDVANNIEVLAQKEVRFFNSANTFYTGLRAGSSSANVTFTLPIADGAANQVLYTNGSAGLAWTTVASVSAITSLNGLTASTQTFATGTSGTDFNISSGTSTHTFNIPYAGSGATGLVTTQAQTIAGSKTFSSQTIISDTTASTTTATGALLVYGGLGVTGQINAASLQTSGNAIISGNLQFNGIGTFGNATSDTITSLARYASDLLPSTDNSYDLGNNSLGWRNFRVSGVGTIATLAVTSSTASTNTTTGALVVTGGVGIGGSLNVGPRNLSYTAANLLAGFATSVNAFAQIVLQNASTGATASSDFIVNNDISTDSTFYGAMGMNSSGYTGSGSFNLPSAVYFTSTSGDLVLGSTTANILRFVYNSGATDSMQITGTAVSIIYNTASTSTSTGALTVVGGVGIGGSLWTSTSNLASVSGVTLNNGTITGTLSGTATSAQVLATTTDTSSTLYLLGSRSSTGFAGTAVYVNTNISFSGSTITATTFSGSLTGTASIATSSVNLNTTTDTTSTLYLLGTRSNGGFAGTAVYVDTSISILGNTITATTFSGTASSATNTANINVTLDTTSTIFITGSRSNASIGSTPSYVLSGVSALGNTLTATTFVGALTGTASIATSSVNSATTTDTTSTLYLLGSRSSTGFAGTALYVDSSISILGSQITAGVWGGTAISAVNGGTGQNTYTIGDILYASSTTALSKLSAGTAASVLTSNGAGTAPSWKAAASGGSPAGSSSWLQYNNSGAFGATSHLAYNGNINNDFVISAPYSGATQGQVNIGLGITGFDGVTLGKFAGSASGTVIAANQASGFTGNFADFQLAGSSKFTIGFDGKITVVGVYSLPTTAGTAGSVLTSNGTGNQFYWSAPGAAGGGSGTVTSGTAGSIAYYTGTGTTVGGSPGFTYTTSGTASTINVFGGSAIGTTIFTVQATSATSVRVGIGTNLPQYELEIVGELSATNKSFVIDHPTKPGKKLRYGSLEGPENGVYVRGELKDSNIIETPDHWIGLVYPDSFTVTLTPIGRFSYLYVEKIEDYKVFIADAYMNPIHCYYTVWAERKDIPKLITEY